MTKRFSEFVDRKDRESKKQLKMVMKLLQHEGFTVDSFLDSEEDPYIFLHTSDDQLSFEGVRIYKLGDIMAYRIQKEKDTHPYGRAYELDLEEMFNDLLADNGDEKKSGEKVIKTVKEQFDRFFKKSVLAEKDLKSLEYENDAEDGTGKVVVRNTNLDYGLTINNRQR